MLETYSDAFHISHRLYPTLFILLNSNVSWQLNRQFIQIPVHMFVLKIHTRVTSWLWSKYAIHSLSQPSGLDTLLTHWGRGTHICVSKLTIIASHNGFSPGRRQAIIWTNAGILLIWPLGTNFSEILIEIYKFPFKKMHLKTSSAKWRPFCLGLNVLTLLVLEPEYSIKNRSLLQLLMPWLLAWPCHEQPWYWLYMINRFLSSTRKDLNHLWHLSFEKW